MKHIFKIEIENLDFTGLVPELCFETRDDAESFMKALNTLIKDDKQLEFRCEVIEVLTRSEALAKFITLLENQELPN